MSATWQASPEAQEAEHYFVVKAEVAGGKLVARIDGDMEVARFPEGSIWWPVVDWWVRPGDSATQVQVAAIPAHDEVTALNERVHEAIAAALFAISRPEPIVKLTTLQRLILTYLGHVGPVENRVLYARRGPETFSAMREATASLINLGLATLDQTTGMVSLTTAGEDRAVVTRYHNRDNAGCPACIRMECVCEVRLDCLGDGPHSLGCHGSHE